MKFIYASMVVVVCEIVDALENVGNVVEGGKRALEDAKDLESPRARDDRFPNCAITHVLAFRNPTRLRSSRLLQLSDIITTRN